MSLPAMTGMFRITRRATIAGVLLLAADGQSSRAAPAEEERFVELDRNADGAVELSEFLAPYAEEERGAGRAAYFTRDADGDGLLSREEFAAEAHRPHLRSLFAIRDADEDGQVSREEYVAPHIGGQWEESARNESVTFDGDGDGFLTLAESA